MAEWACEAGTALHIPSGPDGKHLHISLHAPRDFEGYRRQSCVLVCISTVRLAPYDATCVLEPGEHPFIVTKSYVAYRHTRLDAFADLASLVAKGLFSPAQTASPQLVQKLREGLYTSPHTKRGFKLLDVS